MADLRAEFERAAAAIAANNSLAGSLDALFQLWIDKVNDLASQPKVTPEELSALATAAEDTRAKLMAAVVKGTPAATVPDNPPA